MNDEDANHAWRRDFQRRLAATASPRAWPPEYGGRGATLTSRRSLGGARRSGSPLPANVLGVLWPGRRS